MKVEAILVNHKTPEMTLEALGFLLPALESLPHAHVTIVDSASGDDSVQIIKRAIADQKLGDKVDLIEREQNLGFGPAVNAAFKKTLAQENRPDFFYLLHSDAFPEEGAVEELLKVFEGKPGRGLASSYVHDADGLTQRNAFRFPREGDNLASPTIAGLMADALHQSSIGVDLPQKAVRVEWACSVSLMIRREVLETAGMFDEEFFLFFEEADLCIRARKKGWSTYYVPESKVFHLGGVTVAMSGDTSEQWERSKALFMRKHKTVPVLPESGLVRTPRPAPTPKS